MEDTCRHQLQHLLVGAGLDEEADKMYPGLAPLLSRIGAKTRYVELINFLTPEHHTFVEPFVGSGAIYWNTPPSKKSVVNDLDQNVARTLRMVKTAPTNLESYPQNLDTKEKIKSWFKSNKNPKSIPAKLTYELIRHNNGWMGKQISEKTANVLRPTNPFNKLKKIAEYKARMKNTTVKSEDYAKVISADNRKDTFIFLDPPYENSDGLGYAEGNEFDFERLRKTLDGVKGKWLMTINDSPFIRKLFKGYYINPITIKGHKRPAFKIGAKDRGELLISNYVLPSGWKEHLGKRIRLTGGGKSFASYFGYPVASELDAEEAARDAAELEAATAAAAAEAEVAAEAARKQELADVAYETIYNWRVRNLLMNDSSDAFEENIFDTVDLLTDAGFTDEEINTLLWEVDDHFNNYYDMDPGVMVPTYGLRRLRKGGKRGKGNTCMTAPALSAEEEDKIGKASQKIADELLETIIAEEGGMNEEAMRRYNTTVKNPSFNINVRSGLLNNYDRIHFPIEPHRGVRGHLTREVRNPLNVSSRSTSTPASGRSTGRTIRRAESVAPVRRGRTQWDGIQTAETGRVGNDILEMGLDSMLRGFF